MGSDRHPAFDVWIRRGFGEPARYSIRYEVRDGLGRLFPPPPGASRSVREGAASGRTDGLNAGDLYILQVLVAAGAGGPWHRRDLLPAGSRLLQDLVPGTWTALATASNQVATLPRIHQARTLVETRPADMEPDPDLEPPPPSDDEGTTEMGLIAMPDADEASLPPLDAEDPTDLSLLPPPLARLHALRMQRRVTSDE